MAHILIIPDGNRRYAKKKNMAIEVVYKYISDSITTGLIKYLLINKKFDEMSLFAISRDNVSKRKTEDLQPIYDAQIEAYKSWLNDPILTKKIRFNFVGDLDLLPKDYVNIAKQLQDKTQDNKKTINLLTAYDSHWEVLEACKKAAEEKDFSEKAFQKNLLIQTPIDLIVRTGREKRLSGCPIYQSKYSELFFLDEFYPELTVELMNKILGEFKERNRRYGE